MEQKDTLITLYCLSGLGVDDRAFAHFMPAHVKIEVIPWIEPLTNESLPDYSKRLFSTADLPENYLLAGVSFGGMVAQEFAKIRKPQLLFLISTIESGNQLPVIYRIAAKLNLHKLIPSKPLKSTPSLFYWLFGAKRPSERQLLNEIITSTDPAFVKWAVQAILNWQSTGNSIPILQIRMHGDRDRILPLKGNVAYILPNAGHFCIFTHGRQLSEFVENEISNMK